MTDTRVQNPLSHIHNQTSTDTLEKLAQARGVQRLFGTELVEVDGTNKSAVFKARGVRIYTYTYKKKAAVLKARGGVDGCSHVNAYIYKAAVFKAHAVIVIVIVL